MNTLGAKGIDIFRIYQNVTDWDEVRESGVEFCWAKATDGLRIAFDNDPQRTPRPADPTVAGARSVGIAPGLYHWGKGNSPEAEADVFAAEVIRLGCRGDGVLPPALDAEDEAIAATWAARRDWCIRFLRRLQERIGQDRVAIYMNASWAAALRPDQWDIPGLVIWIAAYGANTGARSTWAITQLYDGPYDVHQYTSLGVHLVNGITANGLDVNEADIPLSQLVGRAAAGGGAATVVPLVPYYTEENAMDVKGDKTGATLEKLIAVPESREHKLVVASGKTPVYIEHMFCWGPPNEDGDGGTGGDPNPDYTDGSNGVNAITVPVNTSRSFDIPTGTGSCKLIYSSEQDFAVTLDPVM